MTRLWVVVVGAAENANTHLLAIRVTPRREPGARINPRRCRGMDDRTGGGKVGEGLKEVM